MTTQVHTRGNRVVANLRAVVSTACTHWSARHTLLLAGAVAAAALPLVVQDDKTIRGIAWVMLFALAGVGANLVVGLGNMASIGHGAFMTIGALAAATLRTDTSLPFLVIVVVSTLIAALAGWVIGKGAVRLGSVQLAVSTWLFAWLVTLFLQAFPNVSGGAGGIALGPAPLGGEAVGFTMRATPAFFYLLALACLCFALLLFRSIERGPTGLALATIKQNPSEAGTIGTYKQELRLWVLVLGAAMAGLAGAIGVQLSGVFDQQLYGILLSICIFISVMVGGPGHVFAPVLGAVSYALLPVPGQPLAPYFTLFGGGEGELVAGVLLLSILWWRAGRATARRPHVAHADIDVAAAPSEVGTGPTLEVRSVTKRYGGLVALDKVELAMEGGRIHGIMGPNGSGKSTLLGIISGHIDADEGRVVLGADDVTDLPVEERLRLGIGRSLQSTEFFPTLTALEHMVAAGLVDRRHGHVIRSAVRTPLARREEEAAVARALGSLRFFGLEDAADTEAGSIPGGRRRMLTIAMAVADRRVALLDEPSSGLSAEEVRQIADVLVACREKGIALVVVEHNLRLLRQVADVVTVLDGGRVIAHGTPDHVFEDELVRRAYLGSMDEGVSR